MVNGNRYIGSAVDLSTRRSQHFYSLRKGNHHSLHLQAAYNKYGEENFVFTVLYECAEEDRLRCEQEEIDLLKPEYNHRTIAYSNYGIKWTNESKERLRNAMVGRIASEETKLKMSMARKGHPTSEETRRKIGLANSIALKGKPGHPISEETRAKMLVGMRKRGWGHPQSAETRAKISAANKGSKSHVGIPCSEKAKEALRQRSIGNTYAKGRVITPEHRQKLIDGMRRKKLEREQNARNVL